MTAPPLRLLHLEDAELDHELALAHLRRGGLVAETRRVETREQFVAALAEPWDAVISDFNLPNFSGLEALTLLRERDPITPFVLVSGEIGEEVAVSAMRSGASDYLLKNNLARLAPALEHAIAAGRTQRAKVAADAALAESRLRLSELAQHLQSSVEGERAAIAREIHDDVGGTLTALKFELDWIRRHSTQEAVKDRAAAALDSVTQALEASQRIMQNLRPAILEQGLVAALQWLATSFTRRTGIDCALSTSPEGTELPPLVPLVAYRTAQEALTNIAKHAQASRVTIELSVGAGVLTVEITDDGRGLSPADLAKARSFGIRGLHERASTVGGWIDLTSRPGSTTLILTVPLTDDVASTHDPGAAV